MNAVFGIQAQLVAELVQLEHWADWVEHLIHQSRNLSWTMMIPIQTRQVP